MDFLHQLLGDDLQKALLIVLNLIVIESLLSIDNAAVLATMVLDLPQNQRGRALKYGIFGAYIFRGICLLFANFLVKIWWLKVAGGLYLLYLAYDFFFTKEIGLDKEESEQKSQEESEQESEIEKNKNPFYRYSVGWLGHFWATIVLVEVMDLAFSIDNVFAVIAFTNKFALICIGVFIGILAMRFVAQFFVSLMEKFPFLEKSAFVIIALLGLKLTLSALHHFLPNNEIGLFLESEIADTYLSVATILIFTIPILMSYLRKAN
ncbi:MAG: hypothetical protein RI894_1276 [Bacteroidota bacterium]|jgi:YkoY family integral membrane protein